MNSIMTWLKNKNVSSHTVAVFVVLLATLISTDAQVRDYVITLFQSHPVWGTDIIALAGIILKYSDASKAPVTPVK